MSSKRIQAFSEIYALTRQVL